jgi:hypothetical protein
MAEQQYAFVKDGVVTNTAIFDDPDEATLDFFKEEHEVDDIVVCTYAVSTGFTVEGGEFIPPKPFPSWTKDLVNKKWVAPVEYPSDGNNYVWDEATLSWVSAIDEADLRPHDPDIPAPSNP